MDKIKTKSKDKERKTFCSCRNSCQKGSGRKRAGCPCKDEGIFCSKQCECGTNLIVCKNNYRTKKAGVESDDVRQRRSNTDADLASDFVKLAIDEESDGDTSEEEMPRRRQSSKKSPTVTTSDVRPGTPSDPHDEYKGIQNTSSEMVLKQVHQIKNGFALIIHNKDFKLRPREGSEKDMEAIKLFCRGAGIELDIKNNLKVGEIREYCKKLTMDESDKFRNYDGFVCFILSHGKRSGICGVYDETISVKEIVSYFQENKDLLGKPKLFFIQACRGGGTVEDDGNTGEQKDTLCPPDSSDVLIAHSTIKGELSYRDTRTGSWFIQTLMEHFKTHAQSLHLMDIMTMVNGDIASSELEGYRQMPIQVSTLTKYVYFNMANVA